MSNSASSKKIGFPIAVSRRTMLQSTIGTAIVLAVSPADSLAKTLIKAGGRELSLTNLHTGEKLHAEYWHNGRYLPDALHAFSVVLRDHWNNKVHPIDPALLDLAHVLRGRLRSNAPLHVVCGYRSPETNAAMHERSAGVAAHSLHMEGKAIDIRLPGTHLANLRRTALSLKLGGVGYYPEDDFVHVDTGRIRHWRG